MKRNALLMAALCGLFIAPQAHAVEDYLGTITSTTSKTNQNTATPFTIPQGARVLIQCDVSVHLEFIASSTGSTSSATGIQLDAVEKWEAYSGSYRQYLAIIAAAGSATTANCKVWRVFG